MRAAPGEIRPCSGPNEEDAMAEQVEPILGATPGTATNRATNQPSPIGSSADAAQQEALALKDRAAEAVSAVGSKASDELGALKDEAMGDARHLAGEAKERVGAEADRAATEVAAALSEAAHELRTMAAHAEHPDSAVAEVVRRAGERAESTAQHLQARGSQGIVDDVSRFARNRPGMFLLGAGALGFAVGRMVRNTDTGSIVDAAKSELSGTPSGASGDGDWQRTPSDGPMGRTSIDLRSLQAEPGQGQEIGSAASIPNAGSGRP